MVGGGVLSKHLLPLCLEEFISKCSLERAASCLPRPAHHLFSCLATLMKLNTEMHVCINKFGIITFILKSQGQYQCNWTTCPQGYQQPS